MVEVLEIDQIKTRYDSEWILLEDPETDETLHVRRGKILWHSKNRDEVYQKALELRPKHSAFLYTGEFPDDEGFVL